MQSQKTSSKSASAPHLASNITILVHSSMHFCLSVSHCPPCPDGMKLAQDFLFFLFYLFFCSFCNTKSNYDVRKLQSFLCVWSKRVHSLNIKHTKAGCNFSILTSVLFREDWDGGKAEVCQSRRAKQWDHPASFTRGSVTEVPHILHHAGVFSLTTTLSPQFYYTYIITWPKYQGEITTVLGKEHVSEVHWCPSTTVTQGWSPASCGLCLQ